MKIFTQIFVFAFFSLFFFHSCIIDVHSTKGNGHIVSKEISIQNYQEVELALGAEVIYEQQSAREPYFQINVDENILDLIDIQVVGNKLIIQSENGQSIQPSRFKIYTNSTNLNKITMAGSGEFYLKGEVNSKDMNVRLSGSGNIVSDSLYCERMSLEITGSGDADLKGASNESAFQITGSGSIKALNFSTQDLTCKITGSGGMQAYVAEKINANITGSGSVRYKGNPQVNTNVTGSGTVERMD